MRNVEAGRCVPDWNEEGVRESVRESRLAGAVVVFRRALLDRKFVGERGALFCKLADLAAFARDLLVAAAALAFRVVASVGVAAANLGITNAAAFSVLHFSFYF